MNLQSIHRYPLRNLQAFAATTDETFDMFSSANTIDRATFSTETATTFATNYEPIAYANSVIDEETGKALEYKDLINNPKYEKKWNRSGANEWGRLAQGVRDVKGTDTIFFIRKSQVPKHKTVTYARIVATLRLQKEEQERTRVTVGGNLIEYNGNTRTETAGLTTAKLLINSVLSTPKARFMAIDLKNFYLETPMSEYEYMRCHISLFPEEIILLYNLRDLVDDRGYVYMEIRKGMYGLPQAGIIANELLQKRLAIHGYAPTKTTPGLWKHKYKPVWFSLVVDDFGVKYIGRKYAEELINILNENYQATVDWGGTLYCGIKIAWDYEHRTATLSMPNYII